MNEPICRMCDKPITSQQIPRNSPLIPGRIYHQGCYLVILGRLDAFYDVLTGPYEDFERWLYGEETDEEEG